MWIQAKTRLTCLLYLKAADVYARSDNFFDISEEANDPLPQPVYSSKALAFQWSLF